MKPVRDRKYLLLLRSRPCLVTGASASCNEDVVAAHVGQRPGVAMKAGDDTCIPLRAMTHQEAHLRGEIRYYQKHMQPRVFRAIFSASDDARRHSASSENLSFLAPWEFKLALSEFAKNEYLRWKRSGEIPFSMDDWT